MKSPPHRSLIDPVLENLALGVDRRGGEVAVVLHLEGTLVGGLLIGQKQYLELHHETMMKMVPGQEERLEASRDLALRVQADRVKAQAPPILLLKEAIIAQGNNKIRMPLWRVRLDAVSGWYLGALPDDFLDTIAR